jgi:site-specific DNA-cytosine methylase
MLNAQRHLSNFARNSRCAGAAACLAKTTATGAPAVDLFCGFGGVTQGMIQAGLNVRLAVDYNPHAVRAHRAWHPEIPCKLADVSQIRPRELAGRFVWASPSCRPWSYANTTGLRGIAHPEYFPLVRLLELAIAAKCLIIENVPGLVERKDGREELRRLESACVALGISFQVLEVSASQFGLEQERRRVFLVCGAPLVWCVNAPRCAPTQPTVTTKTNAALATISELQGVQNPLELNIPDFRSGRHYKANAAPVRPHVARRLVGNAIPPVMAAAVCGAVLEAFTLRGGSHA